MAPSTSQGGLLSNALKTVAGVFGAGKKAKTPDPPKSLQLVASLAKKVCCGQCHGPAGTLLTVTQQEEEDKKAARMKEMELRRQQIVEKKAEVERIRQAEEQKARLEGEKGREKGEGTSKKLPAKPPTTTKKVNRDGFLSLKTCFKPVCSDLRLRRILLRSERWRVTVLFLNRSRHRRQSLPVSKPRPSQSSRAPPPRRKPFLHHLQNLYLPLLPRPVPPRNQISPRRPSRKVFLIPRARVRLCKTTNSNRHKSSKMTWPHGHALSWTHLLSLLRAFSYQRSTPSTRTRTTKIGRRTSIHRIGRSKRTSPMHYSRSVG